MELSPEMRRKLIRLILGGILVNIAFLLVGVNNLDLLPQFGSLFALQGACGFIGLLLVYFGMVRRE